MNNPKSPPVHVAQCVESLAAELIASKNPVHIAIGMLIESNTTTFVELVAIQAMVVVGEDWRCQLEKAGYVY